MFLVKSRRWPQGTIVRTANIHTSYELTRARYLVLEHVCVDRKVTVRVQCGSLSMRKGVLPLPFEGIHARLYGDLKDVVRDRAVSALSP